jgi:hypothetical protein
MISGDQKFTEYERSQVVTLLSALETGWVLVDEEEGFDYVLLFNESRTEMENFKPSKDLIRKCEGIGLIRDPNATFGARPRETAVSYHASAPDWELKATETLLPIVYLYDVTSKGRVFLASEQNE